MQTEAWICSPDREPCFIPSSLRLNTAFCQATYGGKHGLAAASCITTVRHGVPPRGHHCSSARFASRRAAASFTFICVLGTWRKQHLCKYISRYLLPVMLCLVTAFSARCKPRYLAARGGKITDAEHLRRDLAGTQPSPPHGQDKAKTKGDCRCKM